MSADIRDQAIEFMSRQQFDDALRLFRQLIQTSASDWSLFYMAGQCCRFTNDIQGAIAFLRQAAQLHDGEPGVFLGLGIALQLAKKYPEAVEALQKAIKINPDFETAYNSLAVTQELAGHLDLAIEGYEEGLQALSRRIVKAMKNESSQRIFSFRETNGQLWQRCAMYGAVHLCSINKSLKNVVIPTAEQAIEEERTHKHGGLYWIDYVVRDGELARVFLPNYFNTFRETLRQDPSYSNFLGNRGIVLEQLEKQSEANDLFAEAKEFLPAGCVAG